MAQQKTDKRITAVVAAYNEAPRLGVVLEVLTSYAGFDEVIVIDDGSSDNTSEVAKQFPVRCVKNEINMGKGSAMDRGVGLANGDIIFFCDADVRGLSHAMIDDIVGPVLAGQVDMFIGMRNRKWYVAHQVVSFLPLLGGERAVTKALWRRVPDAYKQNFRIEAALNFFAQHYGMGFQYKVFRGLSQIIKEKKYGLCQGVAQRWGMIIDIFSAQIMLHRLHKPYWTKEMRFGHLVNEIMDRIRNNKTE